VGFQAIKCCRHPKGIWLYFCTYSSIEAQAAQPAISDSHSVLQEQKGHNQGQAVPQEILPVNWN
jgi:hypothetical protein